MLKAVLVLFMVAYCLSNPKHFLIETKDQPGKEPQPEQTGIFYYKRNGLRFGPRLKSLSKGLSMCTMPLCRYVHN